MGRDLEIEYPYQPKPGKKKKKGCFKQTTMALLLLAGAGYGLVEAVRALL